MWTDFFSRIVLINLVTRTDRLLESSDELNKYGVPFEVVRAIKNENGQRGISDTLRALFKESLKMGHKKLLVFEDDVKMLVEPNEFDRVMDLAQVELPTDWDMLYLGANIPYPSCAWEYSPHLIKIGYALSLHAVAYSSKCMERILRVPRQLPIDVQIAKEVHWAASSFVTYPLLCTQRPGYSDIESREVSYGHFIEDRYKKVEEYLGLSKKDVP